MENIFFINETMKWKKMFSLMDRFQYRDYEMENTVLINEALLLMRL